ncbi:dnaJ homolog subfamily B member 9-like [Pagrus major]|uniref:dnaJ homolog subfamily B member 9-like n=1 Tax=Pagrus major TaxID=143350 RepID=UPI003CC88115
MAAQGAFHWMQVAAVLPLLLLLSEVLPAASETSRKYYETLSVEPTATDSQIKKSFRTLAIKYHPDKNKSADAEKTFREIVEAYKVLSNKERRRQYDSVGHEAFLKDGASDDPEDQYDTGFDFSFADLFHNFDDGPSDEEKLHFHWSFHQDGEDADGLHGNYVFDESDFSFPYSDEDEDHY